MSTSRRAALGAILSAPLASVPVFAAASHNDLEAQFLAQFGRLVPMCDEYDRIWSLSREPYEQWCQDRKATGKPWADEHEELPSYHSYCAARQPADDIDSLMVELYQPFDGVRFTSLDAILLRVRLGMTFEWLEHEVLDDLTALWHAKVTA